MNSYIIIYILLYFWIYYLPPDCLLCRLWHGHFWWKHKRIFPVLYLKISFLKLIHIPELSKLAIFFRIFCFDLTTIDNNAKLVLLLVDFLNRKAGIRSAFHTWWLRETTNHTQRCIQSVKTLLGQYNLAFQPEKGSDIMFDDTDTLNSFDVSLSTTWYKPRILTVE